MNIQAARAEGYSDDEIADYLSAQFGFDAATARKDGHSSTAIVDFLGSPKMLERLPAIRQGQAKRSEEYGATESTRLQNRAETQRREAASARLAQQPAPEIPQSTADSLNAGVWDSPAPEPRLPERALPSQSQVRSLDNVAGQPRRGTMRGVTPFIGGDQKLVQEVPILDRPEPNWKPSIQDIIEQEKPEAQRVAEARARRPWAEAKPLSTAQNIAADIRDMTSNPVARGAVSGFSELGQIGVGAVRLAADVVGADDVSRFAAGASRSASTIGQGATQDLSGNSKLVADVTSSIVNSAPSIGLGLLGGPALRTLFATSTLNEYNAGRDAGFDVDESLARASIMGAAEAIGERFGFSQQIQLLKGVMRRMPSGDMAKLLGSMIANEIPGEQLTTAIQFLADKVGPAALAPNATAEDYLNAAAETLKVTIGQTLVMGGGPVAISGARDTLARTDRVSWGSDQKIAGAINAADPTRRQADDVRRQLRPTEIRTQHIGRIDDFGATYGIKPNVLTAIKEATDGVPLAELPQRTKAIVSALAQRGIIAAPTDPQALSMLDGEDFSGLADGPTPQPQPAPSSLFSGTVTADAAQPDFGGYFGAQQSVAPAGAEPAVPRPIGTKTDGTPVISDGRYFRTPDGQFSSAPDVPLDTQVDAEAPGAQDGQSVPGPSVRPGADQPGGLPDGDGALGQPAGVGAAPTGSVGTPLAGVQPDGVRPAGAGVDDALNAQAQDDATAALRELGDIMGAPAAQAAAPPAPAGVQPSAAPPRIIARAGRTPTSAVDVEVRPNPDGTLTPFMEGSALLDYDSGQPIIVPAGADDAAIKKAIRAAGAIGDKTNFFPAKASQAPASSDRQNRQNPGFVGSGTSAAAPGAETAAPAGAPPAAPSVRQGKIGDKLEAGEVVLTAGGRKTTPFPKVNLGNKSQAGKAIAAVDRWLLLNAANEAHARGDKFNAQQFEAAANGKPTQSDKDAAEEYLFGQQPAVPQDILRPLVPGSAAAAPAGPAGDLQSRVERRIDAPDGMQAHVFKTDDGYGAGMFDNDAGQYVNGSVVRFTGQDAQARAAARAQEMAQKATPKGEQAAADLADDITTKVYRTHAAAKKARKEAGNTFKLKKVAGGYSLRPMSDKEMAAAAKLGEAAKRRGVDVTKDSALLALGSLGGINRQSASRDAGVHKDSFRHMPRPGRPTFPATGGMTAEAAVESLVELGYLQPGAGLTDLEDLINDEIGGTPRYSFSYEYAAADQDSAADVDAESDAEGRAEREAIMAENDVSQQEMNSLHGGDISAASVEPIDFFTGLPVSRVTPENLAAAMRDMGEPEKAISDEVSRRFPGAQGASPVGSQEAGADGPGGPQAADGARGQAPRDQAAGQEGAEEGLTLEAQTEADLKAKVEREEAAEDAAKAKRAAEQERLRREAEQRDNKARQGPPATVEAQAGDSEAIRQAKADALRALGELGDLLTKGQRLNITPEQEQKMLPVLTKLFDAGFRLGNLKFKQAARWVLEQIRRVLGNDVANQITIDHLQGAYIGMAGKYRDQGADRPAAVAAFESLEQLNEPDVKPTQEEDVGAPADNAGREKQDAPSPPADLERDRQDAEDQPTAVEPPVSGQGSAASAGRSGGKAGGRRVRRPDDPGIPPSGTSSGRVAGDLPVPREDGADGPTEFDAGADESERGSDARQPGVPADPVSDEEAEKSSFSVPDDLKRRAQQRAADAIEDRPGDLENIRATLPYLLPAQQEDVHKAEQRFIKPNGFGMLFTNGTGTGKTFSGLGVIKRFARRNQNNQLILVPDAKIMADWVESGKALGLNITPLESTVDAGKGIVITTYANAEANNELIKRNWDHIVADEAHSLMQGADGEPTGALLNVRAMTWHPGGVGERFNRKFAEELAQASALSKRITSLSRIRNLDDTMDVMRDEYARDIAELEKQLKPLQEKLTAGRAEILQQAAAMTPQQRPRVTFLSATPFAYDKTVDWAEGYLFNYDEGYPYKDRSAGYNTPSPHEYFFMTHFGYRMRYGKLTKPDARVDSGMMQRQFNGWLKKSGVLSNRTLDVEPDYDRRFVMLDSAVGNRIDDALRWIGDMATAEREANRGKKDDDSSKTEGFAALSALVSDKLYGKDGHLIRRYLLEAIKAKEVIPIIKQHLAMGRKIVVFHDFKKGGSSNPFAMKPVPLSAGELDILEEDDKTSPEYRAVSRAHAYNTALAQFRAKFPELVGDALLSDLISPIERFMREIPGTLLINGNEKKSDVLRRYKEFNDDATGPVVALVQSAKNKGWSGHDTTGKHQRVLINLGLPTQPTMTIQQEGRIYRLGVRSNAIFRYLNTGTNWERQAFAETIARRASEAENLGQGEQARALLDAFVTAFEEADTFAPGHEGEGTGGKQRDALSNAAITEYDRAKTIYWGLQKKNAKTKAQEGVDYFATPEPVGLKMVQWLQLRGGEHGLEPSGGHGAIARWFPETVARTAIEPSMVLRSKLALSFDGKIIDGNFEDHNVVNKYDGIAMNPPFGSGGRTAIDHVAKAATHLSQGGRIIAIIPTGPAADAKFDKWLNEEQDKPVNPVAEHPTLGPIYRGDVLKTAASWAPQGIVLSGGSGGSGYPLVVKVDGKSGGSGVSLQAVQEIVKRGPRTEKFRPAAGLELVADIKLPGVTFSRAGTGVMTRIVVIEKVMPGGQPLPATKQIDLTSVQTPEELFDRLENIELPARTKPFTENSQPAKTRNERRDENAQRDQARAEGEQVAQQQGVTVVEHTTAKGKLLKGVVRKDLTPTQAASIDKFTFKKNGGYFIRLEHLTALNEKFPPPVPAAQEPGTSYGAQAADERSGTEEQARAQGFTLKAYRGVSKANPFNDTGTTWLTTSREVAEAYAEEVMGYDDPDVLTVMVNPDSLPRHDASRLTDEQREELGADEFGNPQAVGIYDRSDDHPLGGSRRNVTVIHAPRAATFVVSTAARPADNSMVSEPPADYTAAYETDLFGNPVPAAAGGRADRARRPAAGARNVDAPAAVPLPAGQYATRTDLVRTREQQLGHAGPVKSLADAANALAYLNRSAVERFDGLVTDRLGKPLGIIGGFKGSLAATNIYPTTLLGEALLLPGAANVWLVHNHPSGKSDLSKADEMVTDAVARVFEDTGIKVRGIVAVTRDRWSGKTHSDNYFESGPVAPIPGPSVSAYERQIVVDGRLNMANPTAVLSVSESHSVPAIESPRDAKAIVRSVLDSYMGQPVVVLMNFQHQPIATVPWPADQAMPLRQDGRLASLFRAVVSSNAGAAIIGKGRGMTDAQARNLGGALAIADVRVLDIIDGAGVSTAEMGGALQSGTVFSIADGAPAPYYSALLRAAESASMNAAPASGWKAWLKGLPQKGIKPDEITWSGVEEWLDLQQGKVTRDAITEYLRANGVQVEETVLGAGGLGMSRPEEAAIDRGVGGYGRQRQDTKYGQYTLPGGENYREVLLRLPTGGPSTLEAMSDAELRALILRNDDDADVDGVSRENLLQMISGMELGSQDMAALTGKSAAQYKSPHWDQPNVVAHIRMNDRVDADGKRVLFVEEIQSDWGQEGKKKGFIQPMTPAKEARIKELEAEVKAISDSWGGLPALLRASKDDPEAQAARAKQAELRAEVARIQEASGIAPSGGVKSGLALPAAPFVTKTEGWLNLALKRVMVMAAEGGYDRVAFVNGEQSAERYDLSKQIKMVTAYKETGGGFRISATDNNGNTLPAQKAKDEAELESIVGKELATKIASQKSVVEQYTGLDLKVGGEGMKAFYDTIVPTALKKLLPKVGGGRMGVVGVQVPPASALDPARTSLRETSQQPGFDITPAMRATAAGGLPLFMASDGAPVSRSAAIEGVVQAVTAGWKKGPPVVVLSSTADPRTPPATAAEVRRMRDRGVKGAVRGFWHNGTVYLVASGLRSEKEAVEVLFHEALGHHGLRGVFGDGLNDVLDDLARLNRPLVEAKAEKYGLSMDTVEGRRTAAEEVLAELAQTRPTSSWVARTIAAIRSWLRENIPMLRGMEFSRDELIRNFLVPARNFVERGADPIASGRSMASDMEAQRRWLTQQAADEGYASVDEMLEQNYPLFESLAEQWRAQNPAATMFAMSTVRKGRIRRSIADLVNLTNEQASWKDWYDMHKQVVERAFGADAELFQRILSATSQLQTVKGNVTVALRAYEKMFTGEPFGGLPAVRQNLERIRSGLQLTGPKISEFERGNLGADDAIAVDRHIAQLLFNTSSPNRAQIESAKRRIRAVANIMGWTPKQVQAALWAANQVLKGRDPSKVVSYDKILEQRAETIRAIRSRLGRDGSDGPGGRPVAGADAQQAGAAERADDASEADAVRFSLTPEEEQAFAKAGMPQRRRTLGQAIRSGFDRALELVRNRDELALAGRTGALDQFYGIRAAEKRYLGGALDMDASAYVTARLANGGTSGVLRAALLHGQPRWAANGQHLEKIPGTKGLLQILEPLGEGTQDFFAWMIGNRASRLKREGRENNFTDDDIRLLQGRAAGTLTDKDGNSVSKEDVFKQVAREYAAWKRSILDIAEAAGLIDGDARKVWDHADYIPFYRRLDKTGGSATAIAAPKVGRRGLTGQSSGIRVLRGGEAALNDPIENLLMNTSRLLDASLKNNALGKTIRAFSGVEGVATKIGYDFKPAVIPRSEIKKQLIAAGTPESIIDNIPPEALEGMAKMWQIQQPQDPDVVRVMVGGRPQFYRIGDRYLLRALTSFVPFDFPGLELMRMAKRVLTRTVTTTPDFMLANWVRDSIAAQAITPGFNPAESILGAWKSLRETGAAEAMMFAGATFGSGHVKAGDPTATASELRRILRSKGMSASAADGMATKLADAGLRQVERYFALGDAIENANREAVYGATLKRGGTATAAAFESKDLMDFSLRGAWAGYQLLADTLPFFNARVQGLYRLGRADPKRLAFVGMSMMAATLLLAAANNGEDWYEELEDWQKDTMWHFKAFGVHIKLPKPFEVGVIFATLPERALRYGMNDPGIREFVNTLRSLAGKPPVKDGSDSGEKFAGRVYANLRDQLKINPIPQIAAPALDVYMNWNSFRERPIDSRRDEQVVASLRYNESTSATAREIIDVTAPATNTIGLSPKDVEYLVGGYFGTWGMYALSLSDMAVRGIKDYPDRPSPRTDDLPVLRRFYSEDPAKSTVYESDLYKLRKSANEIARTVKGYEDKGELQKAKKLQQEERAKLAVEPLLNNAGRTLGMISDQRDSIMRNRNLSPEEKRRSLDELQRRRNAFARDVMTRNKAAIRAAE